MEKNQEPQTDGFAILEIRVKSTERDCPRCHAILVLNENEQCYECYNCGYIDCGDD